LLRNVFHFTGPRNRTDFFGTTWVVERGYKDVERGMLRISRARSLRTVAVELIKWQ